MISRINSAVLNGLDVVATEVEVGFSRGIPGIVIVGLPDNAVKESRERLKLAVSQANFDYPQATKIVINLSPADVRKEGSALDLPMAVGIIKNRYRMESPAFNDLLFYGELNLNGDLNPVKGVLNISLYAREKGFRGIVIPFENRLEAQFVKGIEVYALKNLTQVIQLIEEPAAFRPCHSEITSEPGGPGENDFSEIKGQYLAKRVMEIAAAGFHNVLMIGSPGSGKSMISKALPSILPDMSDDEILETSLTYSAAGLLGEKGGLVCRRPFRSPHHTISDVGISGGGKYPVPGEISLAHNGVLFLDEIPYFKKSALEVLRQPLEDGKITVSRSLTSSTFPARFMLVAAMNPSQDAVGLGDPIGVCRQPFSKAPLLRQAFPAAAGSHRPADRGEEGQAGRDHFRHHGGKFRRDKKKGGRCPGPAAASFPEPEKEDLCQRPDAQRRDQEILPAGRTRRPVAAPGRGQV